MNNRKPPKSYNLSLLNLAAQQHKKGEEITARCLRCGAILEVSHDATVGRAWTIKCPNGHFTEYSFSLENTRD
jgi:hypothetical protein